MPKQKEYDTQLNWSTVTKGRIGSFFGSLRNVKTFDSFRNSAFRFYFLGTIGQWGSMQMQQITQSLLIYRLTGSATIVGILALAHAIPAILLSPVGGAVADRVKKKHVLQIGQAAAVVLTLAIAIALRTGYMSSENPGSWWVLVAGNVLLGIFTALVVPVRYAIIPELVEKERVMNAQALNAMGMTFFMSIAPAIAGFLIDVIGFEYVFYIMTGLYCVSIVFTTFLPVTGKTSLRGSNTLADVKEGLKYIRHKPSIFIILGFAVFFLLLSMPIQLMLPIFTEDILKVGATGLGILTALSGAGALVASIVIASLPMKRRGIILVATSLVLSLALVAFAFSQSWLLSIVLMILIGIGRTGHTTTGTTLLLTLSDREYTGRVMGILSMNVGLTGLGTFFAGIFAESVGVEWAIGGFAIVLALISAALFFVPKIRKLN